MIIAPRHQAEQTIDRRDRRFGIGAGISYNAAVVQRLGIGGLMPKAASSANIRPPTSAAFISVYPFLHFGDFIKEPAHTKYGQRCTRPLSVLQIFRSVGDAPVAG